MISNKISLVGLGKLGLPLAACFANAGYETIGVDISKKTVDSINTGASPIQEPELDKLMATVGGKMLSATTEHGKAIRETDITFVLTATPSNPDGSFSNSHIESALISLSKEFAKVKKEYHVFVISSTVVPGSTNEHFIPLIEKYSGKKINVDFGVAFDPDFVALGSVVKDFLNPDFVLIGESEKRAGDIVEQIHKKMCLNKPEICRMAIINAEIAKVCLNAYITTKITFANMIANICEKIPGADCDKITQAIGRDKRISPRYLTGGLSFGGTCFPRDTKAFSLIAAKYGENPRLITAVEEVNRYQDDRLAASVLNELRNCEPPVVGIIGLAFKENTPVITESPAIKLIHNLLNKEIRVIAYDPLAINAAKILFNGEIDFVDSIEAVLEMCGLCVITHKNKAYKPVIEQYIPSKVIKLYDCWRLLDPLKLHELFKYYALGIGKTV